MNPLRGHKLKAATAIAAATALSLAPAVLAAARHGGGAVHLFITPSGTGHGGGAVLLTGAIGDFGTNARVDATGRRDPNGTYALARLRDGSILLDTSALRKAIAARMESARPDPASCSVDGSTSAMVRIVSGTGGYAGIGGRLRVRFTFADVDGRHRTGARMGTCDDAAGPIATWVSISGTGNVSFT